MLLWQLRDVIDDSTINSDLSIIDYDSDDDDDDDDDETIINDILECTEKMVIDDDCCIDNLDACVAEETMISDLDDSTINSDLSIIDYDGNDDETIINDILECTEEMVIGDECCIDNLDACVADFVTTTSQQQPSLRRFLTNPLVELQLALLVLASSFFVGLGTLQNLPPMVAAVVNYGELLVSAVFTIEYLLRWKLEEFSPKYVVRLDSLVDLVAILPGLIKIVAMWGVINVPTLGGALINLRLLRLLRLQRVLKDYETFQKFELALGLDPSDTRAWQLQLARVMISIFTLNSVTAGLIYSAEHTVNPQITDYFTSFYFALITLTTVGFGDLYPVTAAGRWIIGGSIMVGSVVIPAQAAALVEALINREKEKEGMEQGDGGGKSKEGQLAMDSVSVRMDRLEKRVEESNERLDRLLAILEKERQ